MDRQDIDALLIGALYGELTPADEARLTAHLDSHPTDRGALDDLKTARQAVRESRIFELQLDPPQAVSAMLLQEAHRRAPKRVSVEEKEGWFARFARSFMAHPAMAAAAMLVLVIGVAGTLYVKKGADFADREVSAPTAPAPTEIAKQEPTVGGAAAGSAAASDQGVAETAATDGYNANLYEAQDEASQRLRDSKGEGKLAKESATDKWRSDKPAVAATAPSKMSKNKGIAVSTERGVPKELESDRSKDSLGRSGLAFDGDVSGTAAPSGASRGASGGGGAGTGSVATVPKAPVAGNYAQPPPPPAQKADDVSIAAAPTTKPAESKPQPKPTTTATSKTVAKPPADSAAPAPEPKREESSLLAWAKEQHQRTVALVNKRDCAAAAKVALGVSGKAPEYYAQYMATDRALKSCMQYINNERDKDAEKSAKSRAQKRVNADEPALNSK